MSASKAIRLDAGSVAVAAIALHEIIEVVTEGDIVDVPKAPPYCHELLYWRGQWIPVFDLAGWYCVRSRPDRRFHVIVGYMPGRNGEFRCGCIRVSEFPKIVKLENESGCCFPADEASSRIAHSGFEAGDVKIPILSLRRLFETGQAG